MGLDVNAARFLLGEKSRGLSFGRTLTLGRQDIYMPAMDYSNFLSELGVVKTLDIHADDFFRGLGASPFLSMDTSDYEGADVLHDLNQPINPIYYSSFDTLIDGGTLEHVFNFPIAIRNCMEMVRVGGQLILMTPWHNYPGHGFYEFSPELFYNILSKKNGYSVERMLVVTSKHWYSIKNPSEVNHRIEISSRDQILLFITARRLSEAPIFKDWPQQSDYSSAWKESSYSGSNKAPRFSLGQRLSEIVPFLEGPIATWQKYKRGRALSPPRNRGLVRICPSSEIPNLK